MKNQEGKIELQKKVDRRISLQDSTYLAARPPSYVIFVAFFSYSLPLVYSDFIHKKFFAPENGGVAGAPIPTVPMALISEIVNESFVIL